MEDDKLPLLTEEDLEKYGTWEAQENVNDVRQQLMDNLERLEKYSHRVAAGEDVGDVGVPEEDVINGKLNLSTTKKQL